MAASILERNPAILRPETWQLRPAVKKPTHWAVWRAENEPVSDGGNPPRPIRLFRMAEHSTPDLFASRVPVHSSLVQKSVATITNLAGRLPPWMLGNREQFRKRKMQNSWQEACWQRFSYGRAGVGTGASRACPERSRRVQ